MNSSDHTELQPDAKVIIDSPGNCDVRMIRSLKTVCPQNEQEIARMVFQSPSVLLDALDTDKARQISTILNEAGAHTRIAAADEHIEQGTGEYELAIVVPDISRVGHIFQEILVMLQVKPMEAVRLMVQSPAVMVGKLSRAAANAFAGRLRKVGAEVDLSRYQEAAYDLFVSDPDLHDLNRLNEIFNRNGIRRKANGDAGWSKSSFALPGLNWSLVDRIRDELREFDGKVKLLNRDFSRFDISLKSRGDNPQAVMEVLRKQFGIPESVHQKIFKALPVVIAREVPFNRMQQHLDELTRAGAEADARLTSLQTFDLRIKKSGDTEKSMDILRLLGLDSIPLNRYRHKRAPFTIEGPFSPLQARWMQKDLRSVGNQADLIMR